MTSYYLFPEFHVNIKLSSCFSTGEVFWKDIPLEYHLKIKSPPFTFIRRRILEIFSLL